MSKRFSPAVQYYCSNGCQSYGRCPGHDLRIVYLCTSGHVAIEERPLGGKGEWVRMESFDDGRWSAIFEAAAQDKDLLRATTPLPLPKTPE